MSEQKPVNQYAERDVMELGGYYIRHVIAMTREKLHEKSDIAAELGFRDMQIDTLTKQRDELLAALESLLRSSVMSVSHSEYVAVFDEANAVMTKAKCGAANHSPDTWKMVPDGWKLVPVEPTDEMLEETCERGNYARNIWEAMLSAAPKFEGGAA